MVNGFIKQLGEWLWASLRELVLHACRAAAQVLLEWAINQVRVAAERIAAGIAAYQRAALTQGANQSALEERIVDNLGRAFSEIGARILERQEPLTPGEALGLIDQHLEPAGLVED